MTNKANISTMTRRIVLLLTVLMLVLAATGTPREAQAKTADPGSSGMGIDKDRAEKVAPNSEPISRSEADKAIKYWTKERMKKAKPMLPDRSSGTQHAPKGPTGPDGPAKKIDGSLPSGLQKAPIVQPQSTPQAAATSTQTQSATTSTAICGVGYCSALYYSYPFPYTRVAVPGSYYTSYPYSTMGKVFFQVWNPQYQRWVNSSCSGTVVAAENKSTVWTAGHCVRQAGSGGRLGPKVRNWVFAPAYQNGYAPRGVWAAKYTNTTGGWAYYGSYGDDAGAVVVYPSSNGTRLANYVGSLGITWNQPVRQNWRAFGYPAYDLRAPSMNFNGMYNYMCTAPTAALTNYNAMGIGCDMTGGSSGGAWTIGLSSSGGWVNSVNSHKNFRDQPKAMYGPYQGTAEANLFNAMRGL